MITRFFFNFWGKMKKTFSWKFTDELSIKYLWIRKWGRWIRPIILKPGKTFIEFWHSVTGRLAAELTINETISYLLDNLWLIATKITIWPKVRKILERFENWIFFRSQRNFTEFSIMYYDNGYLCLVRLLHWIGGIYHVVSHWDFFTRHQ